MLLLFPKSPPQITETMIAPETQTLLHRIVSESYSDHSREREEAITQHKFKMANQGLFHSSINIQGAAKIYREHFSAFVRNTWVSIEKALEEIGFEPNENSESELHTFVCQAINPFVDRENQSLARMFSQPMIPVPKLDAAFADGLRRVQTSITIFVKKIGTMNAKAKFQGGSQINYYLQGDNPRVNINSHDQSHNVVISEGQLFTKLREAISSAEVEADLKNRLLEKIEEGKVIQAKSGLLKGWFGDFMALAADCITVVQPFVPALAELIARH